MDTKVIKDIFKGQIKTFLDSFQPKISKKQLEILKTVFVAWNHFQQFFKDWRLVKGGWGMGLHFGKSKYFFTVTAMQKDGRMVQKIQTQTNSKHGMTGDVGDRTRGLLIADQTLYH